MAQKRKKARGRSGSGGGSGGSKRRPTAPPPATRRRMQTPPPMREIPLQQGLRALGAEGARSLFSAALAFAVLAAIAGAAFLAWSLRPEPVYASDGIEAGSPLDTVFHVRNSNAWVALAHPAITCGLTWAGQAETPPVAARDVVFASGDATQLAPGQSATFKCPLHEAFRGARAEELSTVMRSELVFRLTYGLPFGLSWHMTEKSRPFVLDTKHLPPRWTEKP